MYQRSAIKEEVSIGIPGVNTFIELQPANAQRPPGITHFGIEVEDVAAAREMFNSRGAGVAELRGSSPGVILADIDDPTGIRIELLEFPSEPVRGLYRR